METLDWDGLHVVLEVHRAGSLAGAARALGINATTVGRRLAAFEASAGSSLFVRSADGLVATEAGDALVEHAQRMEQHASLARRSIEGDSTVLEGMVRIAMSEGFATYFMVDHLAEFRSRHPRIAVEVVGSTQLVDLTRGEIDLALRFSRPGAGVPVPSDHAEVRAQRVGVLGIGVYASRSYLENNGTPDHADEVRGHQLIVCKPDASYFPGFSWMETARGRNSVPFQTNSPEVMAAAISAGLGIGALPAFMLGGFENLIAITPPDVVDSRDLWLLTPAERRRVARVRVVREFLLEVLDHWEPVLSGRMHAAKMRRRTLGKG